MKRILLLFICLTLLLSSALASDYFMPDPVGKQVDELFRKSRTTGGSVVVAKNGKIVFTRDYGFAQVRSKQPVTPETYFKLASITKMVTSIGLLQLVENGQLDLDADISRYFGFKIANAYYPNVPLTVRQLMSHTASVSESGGFSNERNKVSDLLAADKRRKSNFHPYAPGTQYTYSNFGAGLAGAVMESVSGLSVNSYMTKHVFAPLQITAAYKAGLLPDGQNVASQYKSGQLNKSARRYIKEPYEDFASPDTHYRTSVGGIWIRSRDLMKLLIALAGDGSYEGTQLLKPETIQMMRTDQKTLGKSVTGDSPYGLFLERNDTIIKGRTVYGHQGMSDCTIVNAYFEPISGFAIVVLNNGCSMKRRDRVGILTRNLIEYLYPLYGVVDTP